jgi:hypothetical protein
MMPPKHPTLRAEMAWTFACVVVGAFMIAHAAMHASAIGCACDGALRGTRRTAVGVAVTWVLVLAPFVANAAAAVRDARSFWSRPKGGGHRWTLDALTTAAGVGALGFVVLHAVELRHVALRPPFDAVAIQSQVNSDLSSTAGGLPFYALAYVIGTACACFFVFGRLATRLATPRATAPPAARRLAAAFVLVAGVAVWACFSNVIIFHATGRALVGGPATVESVGRCP